MSGIPSDEVAEDYKGALEDLVTNDRYQIANLTMIAKENIEHAEAISRVLANHIKRAPPTRKLPALYVLDSLVKNIGTPYTVYFGRDLHTTYMLAYSQVDGNVRRKLEEMLRTWREPVPGSLSHTPVFPIPSTQSIVDTLNKYRAATAPKGFQQQQQQPAQVGRASQIQPFRNTPTPPQNQVPIQSSFTSNTPQPQNQYTSMPPQTAHTSSYASPVIPQYQAPTPQAQQTYPVPNNQNGRHQSSVDLAKLHADIDDLTTDAKIDCATHPMDSAAQQKLTTLQTLKEILESGSASEQDLLDIKATIGQEVTKKAAKQQAPSQPTVLPMPLHMPFPPPPPQSQYPPHQPINAQSFLNSSSLAELLRATSNLQTNPQPQQSYVPLYQQPVQQYSTPPASYVTPALAPAPPIPVGALSILEQLRGSGMFSGTPAPPAGVSPPVLFASSFTNITTEIKFATSSIRTPRLQMVTTFLNERPNQCTTCGRRFTSDDGGREKKTRHLDWHFKTKARMIDAEKRGLNRSWYVDEREWISMKEFDDDVGPNDDALMNGFSPSAAVKKKPQDYVRAPTDPNLRNAPCPIDQEPFKSEWSEEVQDFIWKDAVKVGARYYHASCYREATKDRDKDGGATPMGAGTTRTATPDSVLGKRKAEELETNAKTKIKLEA